VQHCCCLDTEEAECPSEAIADLSLNERQHGTAKNEVLLQYVHDKGCLALKYDGDAGPGMFPVENVASSGASTASSCTTAAPSETALGVPGSSEGTGTEEDEDDDAAAKAAAAFTAAIVASRKDKWRHTDPMLLPGGRRCITAAESIADRTRLANAHKARGATMNLFGERTAEEHDSNNNNNEDDEDERIWAECTEPPSESGSCISV